MLDLIEWVLDYMYINSSNISDILVVAKSLSTGHNDLFTLFFADKDIPDIEELQKVLSEAGIRFMGGITPALIVGTTLKYSGTLIRRYQCASGPFVVPNFTTNDIPRDIVENLEMPSPGEDGTVMMYFSFPNATSHFLQQIYGLFGNGVTYIGSGLGYEDLVVRRSVFSNEVFSDNAAIFAVLSLECTVAARHGFIPISDPMMLTATDLNRVEEINWKNPRDEYLRIIAEERQQQYPNNTLEECIMFYPMVFETDSPESVCRVVTGITPDGSLECGSGVSENALFRIAKYSYESLVEAAVSSAVAVTEDLQERPTVLFLFNCCLRKLITGEKFSRELEAVNEALSDKSALIQIEGILSLGEISSMGTGMVECLNFTSVAGRFYEN